MQDKKKSQLDALYHVLMMLQIALNGFAVGGVVRNTADMIEKGYDKHTMIMALMYLVCVGVTGQSVYKMYKSKKQIDNQDRQR